MAANPFSVPEGVLDRPAAAHSSTCRVSVLINTYNHARFLRSCIDSVLAQTRAPDEIIVYDDGSTDDSTDILRSYGERIRVLSRPNGGRGALANQAQAIHQAFLQSTGALILLLDGDDLFLPDKIDRYERAFLSDPAAVMVQAPMRRMDLEGRSLGDEWDSMRHQADPLDFVYRHNELNIFYPTSSLAFSRSYLSARLPLDMDDALGLWPDARLALLAPHFGRVITLDEPLSCWRRHPGSLTVRDRMQEYTQLHYKERYFNAFCRVSGLPTIQIWRNPRTWRVWLRERVMPRRRPRWFQALRWSLMSRSEKQRLQGGAGR